MDDSRKYFDPQILARLEGLELKARTIVEGFVSGLHRSPYHGFSVEFAEHRDYVPGDDLRYVDWKVFGKTDRYYVKRFEEETNFDCYLLVDASESMGYRSDRAAVSKLEYAKYIAASLAFLVVSQHDAVGLATFDRQVRDFLSAGTQAAHVRQLVHVLEQTQPAQPSALGPVLHELAERIRRRGLVIVISDLFDDVEAMLAGLKHCHYRRHDVSVLQVIDPAEEEFPFEEPTLFHGLEGLPDRLADPRSLQKAYRREFESFLRSVRGGCRELHIDHALLRTDMPLDAALIRFLSERRRRVRAG